MNAIALYQRWLLYQSWLIREPHWRVMRQMIYNKVLKLIPYYIQKNLRHYLIRNNELIRFNECKIYYNTYNVLRIIIDTVYIDIEHHKIDEKYKPKAFKYKTKNRYLKGYNKN